MPDHIDAEIAALRAQIRAEEEQLTALESEVIDLRHDLADFQARYDRLITPLEIRLDAVKEAIAELEAAQWSRSLGGAHPLGDYNPQQVDDSWALPEDYVSVDEQFRQTWSVPPESTGPDTPTSAVPKPHAALSDRERAIKQLYRQLARRYHPDLATDPAEQQQRNALMARINSAYADRDLDTLQALIKQPPGTIPAQPLAELQLKELRQVLAQLEARVQALAQERITLLTGDMMRLMVESKLVRGRGRDLLAEMAAQLDREYTAAMIRLEQLRKSRG